MHNSKIISHCCISRSKPNQLSLDSKATDKISTDCQRFAEATKQIELIKDNEGLFLFWEFSNGFGFGGNNLRRKKEN